MKTILVISDTHIPTASLNLPIELIEKAKEVDCIIHAGDISTMDVLYELKTYNKNIYAVKGNADDHNVKEKLADKLIIDIEGIKIGITHGRGGPWGIENRVKSVFRDYKYLDIIVFGHSHYPLIKKEENILLINPGSPTDKRYAPYNSYVMLNIDKKDISSKIIKI